jgi:P-type Cu2+ transporter
VAAPDYEVVHSLPGRARIRLPAIRHDQPLAAGLKELIAAQKGVLDVRVNAECASAVICFEPSNFDLLSWLNQLQLNSIVRKDTSKAIAAKHFSSFPGLRRATFAFEAYVPPKAQFVLGTLSLVSTLAGAPPLLTRSLLYITTLPILNRALQMFLDEKRIGADALDSVTCIVLTYNNGFLPASLTTFMIGLGELLRDLITGKCQQMISHQFALCERSAWLVKGHKRVRSPVLDLKNGDVLVVYAGELISFDGKVVQGSGTVVPASPEMDFEPRYVQVGDSISFDTLLTEGKLFVSHERSTEPRVVDHVRDKQKRRWLQRTKLHRNALRDGYKRIWPVLGLAAWCYVISRDMHRTMAIICFDFLTGIRIAIPIAVLSAMYKAGRRGIVIRNASALEGLSEIDTIIFARSGTLTALRPSVTEVFVCTWSTLDEVTSFAAAVEQRYNHLAAYAIYSYAHLHTIPVPERTKSSVLTGLGVIGEVKGRTVLVGSARLMELQEIDLSEAKDFLGKCQGRGDSRVCVAIGGKLAGVISYQDPLREDARDVVTALNKLGITEIAMTTGGSVPAAEALAKQAGIQTVHYRTSPEDQARIVRDYKKRGRRVAVVGFDASDTLALEQADVAIAFETATDVARHRADIVLTTESLSGLVDGVEIAREGMDLARQNLHVVSVPNWMGLVLTSLDQTALITATLLNNGSVIVGAANGMRPLMDEGSAEDDEAMDEAAIDPRDAIDPRGDTGCRSPESRTVPQARGTT